MAQKHTRESKYRENRSPHGHPPRRSVPGTGVVMSPSSNHVLPRGMRWYDVLILSCVRVALRLRLRQHEHPSADIIFCNRFLSALQLVVEANPTWQQRISWWLIARLVPPSYFPVHNVFLGVKLPVNFARVMFQFCSLQQLD